MKRRNVEVKVPLVDPAAVRARAEAVAGGPFLVERQEDVYFPAPEGRLKLRRRWRVTEDGAPEEALESHLIPYRRPDMAGSRASDFHLLPLPADTTVGDVLALALGVEAVVRKRRAYRVEDGVRIHLDEVDGLGAFLELEAFVDETCDDATARRKVDDWLTRLGLTDAPTVPGSYRESIRARTPGSSGKSRAAS